MREFLFRAKHIHKCFGKEFDGRWIEGYLSDMNHINSLELQSEFLIDPKTICQYIGLNDNTKWEQLSESEKESFLLKWNYKKNRRNIKEDWNGKRIFEGDIIKICFDDEEFIGKVCYNNDFTRFSLLVGTYPYDISADETQKSFKVIGNIFDNPELLSPN